MSLNEDLFRMKVRYVPVSGHPPAAVTATLQDLSCDLEELYRSPLPVESLVIVRFTPFTVTVPDDLSGLKL